MTRAASSISYSPKNHNWNELRSAAVHFARLWCNEVADAEDIAQEAMITLLCHRRPIREAYNWLFVVIKRRAIRAIAHQRKRQLQTQSRNTWSASSPMFEQRILIQDILSDRRLRARDRLLVGWVLLGYSHAQIAGHLGCAARDVGQHLARALKRIAAQYQC
jgi:RNA polymerase sigma factor (sigma-70 family)